MHPDDLEPLEAIVDTHWERRPFELDLTDADLEAHAATDADSGVWEGLADVLARR